MKLSLNCLSWLNWRRTRLCKRIRFSNRLSCWNAITRRNWLNCDLNRLRLRNNLFHSFLFNSCSFLRISSSIKSLQSFFCFLFSKFFNEFWVRQTNYTWLYSWFLRYSHVFHYLFRLCGFDTFTNWPLR